jgi:hypothetical protein
MGAGGGQPGLFGGESREFGAGWIVPAGLVPGGLRTLAGVGIHLISGAGLSERPWPGREGGLVGDLSGFVRLVLAGVARQPVERVHAASMTPAALTR